jgi:signal transduction histidine kinase
MRRFIGLTTMRDRAQAIGAQLTIASSGRGGGTAVTVVLDRDR